MKPITLAITGASGAIYGLRALDFLLQSGFVVNLILSDTAHTVLRLEHGITIPAGSVVEAKQAMLAHFGLAAPMAANLNVWSVSNLAAAVSSGSYRTTGMLIMPCSMGTVARIASGTSEDLVSRCADVCLKERFKLVLVPRECPLSTLHLANLHKLSSMGVHIVPAMPAFYHLPQTIDDLVDFVVGKAMDAMDIDNNLFKRWLSAQSSKSLA